MLPFIPLLLAKIFFVLSGPRDTPSSKEGISDGNFTLPISFICLYKYVVLTYSFEAGSNMSPTWGKTADIVGICDACVIGVDLARGVTILVVPDRVFA